MTALAERGAADGGEAFVVDVDGFAGPLDLLLALAREQRVDLARISIVALADQYLAFVAGARRRNLTLAAEYLVMAAWLAFLKSRLLLPRPVAADPAPEVEAAALARQLQRLDAMRRLAARLLARPQLGRDFFLRPPAAGADAEAVVEGGCTLAELLSAYGRVRRRRRPQVLALAPLPLLAVDEALAFMRARLGTAPGWESLWCYLPPARAAEGAPGGAAEDLARRAAVAATFVAALELAREGALRLRQGRPFGPLFVLAAGGREAADG